MPKWILSENPPQDFLDKHPELPPTISRLLWNRNLRTQKEIDEFLNPDYSEDIHDPFLFRDMEKACKIIFDAIKKQKKIYVHGDYDADGVTATTILITTLKKLGATNTNVFIPHREEDGYGLNENTVKFLNEQKTELIITCDCGISNTEEVKLAKKLGMDIIITDHHTVPDKLPKADAIIHPKVKNEKYPDKGLAGGAVAFKLAQGLLQKHKQKNETLPDGDTHEGFEKWMLDLVALATIGDMVPLLGESRTLTKYGLIVLNKTQNLGLQELFKVAGIVDEEGQPKRGKFDATTVGFQIVPRINAAGRMDHANTAYELLSTKNLTEAQTLAQGLQKNNLDRQKLTENVVKQAKEQIQDKQEDNQFLFAYSEDWPAGILGLVAGRLKDLYYKPVFIATKNEDGDIVASGRSISEFNVIEALQELDDLLIKYGGHPQACGLSIKPENWEKLKTELTTKTKDKLKNVELVPQIHIDAKVELDDVDWKLYDLLDKFSPFGMNNEEPKYSAYGLEVISAQTVGKTEKHLKIMVKHNSHIVRKTIAFGFGDTEKYPEDFKNTLQPGTKIDMVFSVGVNEWNGNRELELKVTDLKVS